MSSERLKTANERASEILGHQEDCDGPVAPGWGHCGIPCTCSHSPEIQVAAIRGALRKEHDWTEGPGPAEWLCTGACEYSRVRRYRRHHLNPPERRGPCAPPIDDGERWRMLRELVATSIINAAMTGRLWTMIDNDTVVEEYIAAHDAGLLEGGSDD